jgi:hypothetical protein
VFKLTALSQPLAEAAAASPAETAGLDPAIDASAAAVASPGSSGTCDAALATAAAAAEGSSGKFTRAGADECASDAEKRIEKARVTEPCSQVRSPPGSLHAAAVSTAAASPATHRGVCTATAVSAQGVVSTGAVSSAAASARLLAAPWCAFTLSLFYRCAVMPGAPAPAVPSAPRAVSFPACAPLAQPAPAQAACHPRTARLRVRACRNGSGTSQAAWIGLCRERLNESTCRAKQVSLTLHATVQRARGDAPHSLIAQRRVNCVHGDLRRRIARPFRRIRDGVSWKPSSRV